MKNDEGREGAEGPTEDAERRAKHIWNSLMVHRVRNRRCECKGNN
jgi:hypothetical protein